MILGAVLAGGESRRFGSDKALAVVAGERLIDRAIAALRAQCDAVIVCGRDVRDRPEPGLGPLGGLAAALHHARGHGYALVLSVPCDVPDLPNDLLARVGSGPAYAADCPVIGVWPATLSASLDTFLAASDDRSLRAWARHCGARSASPLGLANINRPEDLIAYRKRAGSCQSPVGSATQ